MIDFDVKAREVQKESEFAALIGSVATLLVLIGIVAICASVLTKNHVRSVRLHLENVPQKISSVENPSSKENAVAVADSYKKTSEESAAAPGSNAEDSLNKEKNPLTKEKIDALLASKSSVEKHILDERLADLKIRDSKALAREEAIREKAEKSEKQRIAKEKEKAIAKAERERIAREKVAENENKRIAEAQARAEKENAEVQA